MMLQRSAFSIHMVAPRSDGSVPEEFNVRTSAISLTFLVVVQVPFMLLDFLSVRVHVVQYL